MIQFTVNLSITVNSNIIIFKLKERIENNMAYKITDKCIKCGACGVECPVGCISEGEERYIIDKEQCIGCGNCASICPVEAPEEDVE